MPAAVKTILLVECDPDLAAAVDRALEDGGFSVTAVHTGEDAVRALRDGRAADLILMGQYPGGGMDAAEAAEKILADREIPLLFLCRHDEKALIEKTARVASYGYVAANSGDALLCASVNAALRLHEVRMIHPSRESSSSLSPEEKKLDEKTLLAREKAIDTAINGIAITDSAGNLTYVNQSCLNMLGCDDKAMILGKPAISITASEEQALRVMKALGSSGGWVGELAIRKMDDSFFDAQVAASIIKDNAGGIVSMMISFLDITKQKIAEEALRDSERQYRLLVDSMADLVAQFDTHACYSFASPSYERVLGFSPDELKGSWAPEFIHPDERDQVIRAIEAIIQTGTGSIHFRHRHRDGRYLWIESTVSAITGTGGTVIGSIMTGRDITRRKEAEIALERLETFNRKLIESSPVGILVLDRNGIINFENKTMQSLMGVPSEVTSPAVGMNIADLHPVIESGLLPLVRRVMAGETVIGLETRYRSLYGKEIDLEINAAPLIGADNNADGCIVNLIDITERNRARALIEKYSSDMEFLSRTAMEFIDLPAEQNIYEYIAHRLHRLVPEFRVIVTEVNDTESTATVRAVEGIGGIVSSIMTILGRNPVGMVAPLPDEARKVFNSERIVPGPEGIYELAGGAIPKVVSATLDSLLDIGTIYGMAFVRDKIFLGTVVLISPRGKTMENASLVEAFIKQASVAIQKNRVEEALAKSVEEKGSLLRELQHRVKNSMSIITGLIALEADRFDDEKLRNSLTNIRDRVSSLSNLYDLLFQSNRVREIRLDQYLTEISENLMASYSTDQQRVNLLITSDEINMDVKQALPVGLILNELFTNSLKYAFPGNMKGEIRIELKKIKHEAVLSISDSGIGIQRVPHPEKFTGVGMELVRMLLVQLKGKLETGKGGGTSFRITIPL